MATTRQLIDKFDISLATWAGILLASSQAIKDDINASLWGAPDLEVCELQIDSDRIFVETVYKETASAGGVVVYKKYRYYIPWSDIQPNLGNYSTTPADAFTSASYDLATQLMVFIFKEANVDNF